MVFSSRLLSCGPSDSLFDGFDDLAVPGAAADVAGQGSLDLIMRRAGRLVEQCRHGHHEPRRAESALDSPGVDHRFL